MQFTIFVLILMVYKTNALNFLSKGFHFLPNHLKYIINNIPVSKNCTAHVKTLLQGIRSEKLWALESVLTIPKKIYRFERKNVCF